MTRLPRLLPSLALPALLAVAVAAAAAVVPTEWRQRQPLAVPAAGLMKLEVPAAAFDAAQPNLADLRLLDPAGREISYLLDRPSLPDTAPNPPVPPRSFRVVPGEGATELLIETGTTEPLDALLLETSAPFFLKAAHAEISDDGATWRSLGPALPLFRQFGAEQLRVALGRNRGAFLRLTLDDQRSRPVAFTGGRLQRAPRTVPPPLPQFGARITGREEFAGETVLTVQLDGRNAPLASLALETNHPVFMRRVTVTVRELQGDVAEERTVATGTIYRVDLEGAPRREHLQVPLNFTPATRELLIHIHHGDSPPLEVINVRAFQHPVHLFFHAAGEGSYTLLSGNAQATRPSYDLAAYTGDLRAADSTALTAGPREETPGYRPRGSLAEPPLPEVPLTGAAFSSNGWTQRQPVQLAAPGVQELELPASVLAGSRSDLADLRLVRAGHQVPYLLERTTLARSLALSAKPDPDPKRPAVSVWRLALPHVGLPLRRLTLSSDTPLFQRQFRVYEKVTGSDGRSQERTLASGTWSRTPEPGSPRTRVFDLSDRLQGDTLYLETDNGDNPPIALTGASAEHAVTRVVFRAMELDGLQLVYAHPRAAAPRYDLNLVAAKLLTAERHAATLGAGETARGSFARGVMRHLTGGIVFWSALAMVVAVLLTTVAKLLPKPPAK